MTRIGIVAGGAFVLLAGCAKVGPPPVVPMVEVPARPVVGGVVVATAQPPHKREADGHAEGDKVEVEWRGRWLPAVLSSRTGERWRVHYEGRSSEFDELVTEDRIRERSSEPEESPELEEFEP